MHKKILYATIALTLVLSLLTIAFAGTLASVTIPNTVTVVTKATLTPSETSIAWGNITQGESLTKSITITNNGAVATKPLTITNGTLSAGLTLTAVLKIGGLPITIIPSGGIATLEMVLNATDTATVTTTAFNITITE